jgi:hypothetical protein
MRLNEKKERSMWGAPGEALWERSLFPVRSLRGMPRPVNELQRSRDAHDGLRSREGGIGVLRCALILACMPIPKSELLERIEQGLSAMAPGDIKLACRPGDTTDGAKMAGFLLSALLSLRLHDCIHGPAGRQSTIPVSTPRSCRSPAPSDRSATKPGACLARARRSLAPTSERWRLRSELGPKALSRADHSATFSETFVCGHPGA